MLFLYRTYRNPPLPHLHTIQRDFILRKIPTFYLVSSRHSTSSCNTFFYSFNYSTDCIFISINFISQTDARDPYCLLSLLLWLLLSLLVHLSFERFTVLSPILAVWIWANSLTFFCMTVVHKILRIILLSHRAFRWIKYIIVKLLKEYLAHSKHYMFSVLFHCFCYWYYCIIIIITLVNGTEMNTFNKNYQHLKIHISNYITTFWYSWYL